MPKKKRNDKKNEFLPDLAVVNDFVWYALRDEPYRIVSGRQQPPLPPLHDFPLGQQSFLAEPVLDRAYLREYKPFETNPFLYREFGNLERSDESILEFALKYGQLGIKEPFYNEESRNPFEGERTGAWVKAMNDIAIAIDFWDSIKAGDIEGRLEWKKHDDSSLLMHHFYEPLGAPIQGPHLIIGTNEHYPLTKKLESKDMGEVAQYTITHYINTAFSRYADAIIQYPDKENFTGTPKVYAYPKNLLGWFWFQLAQEVTREMLYFECLYCGTPVIKPITRGQPSKFCSASCRVKFSQQKAS